MRALERSVWLSPRNAKENLLRDREFKYPGSLTKICHELLLRKEIQHAFNRRSSPASSKEDHGEREKSNVKLYSATRNWDLLGCKNC